MAEVLTAAGPIITAATGVYGAIDESGQNAQARADAERSGQRARNQISRLQQGPAPMPEYGQSVQGYGMPDANGQYAPISAPPQPQFTDGPPQGGAQSWAPAPMQQPTQDPIQGAMMEGYMQGLAAAQQPPQAWGPQQMFGAAAPVWFDDGATERGRR